MSLPCYKTLPRVLFVDDDNAFIFALEALIPSWFPSRYAMHVRGVDCILQDQERLLLHEQALLEKVCASNKSTPIMAAVEFLCWPDRQKIFSVLVADHFMPAESGISLCSRHAYPGLQRLLLTGADADLAICAFNKRSIDHFIPKQTPSMSKVLIDAVASLHEESVNVRSRRLLQSLSTEHAAALSLPPVRRNLSVVLERWAIQEYVILDQPFAILGRTKKHELVWFALEDDRSLDELAEIIGEFPELSQSSNKVRSGQLIPNLDLSAQVQGVVPRLAQGERLGEDLHIAAFEFEAPT